MEKKLSKMQRVLIKIIRAYKMVLSPMIGNSCRFHPTCSSYGIEAVKVHGSFYGSYLTIKRVLRCNPLFKAGIDNVPKPKSKKQKNQKSKNK